MARRPDAAVVLLALAGLALAVGASMSLSAAFQALPGEPTITAMRARLAVSPEAAAAAARGNLRAAEWFESGRYLTDAALALTAAGAPPADFPPAGAVVTRALAEQPISPHNWARLAIARRTAGDGAGAMRAWEMSVLGGRYVPGLMVPRLAIGFDLIGEAGPEQLRLLGDQVRIVAAIDAPGLAELARRRRAEPFVRAALSAAPDLLVTFETGRRAALK